MLIRHILATKGAEVVWVPSDTPVSDALQVLRDRNIGAVVVSDDDGATPAGILSERDVVRHLAVDGPAILDRPTSALMTAEVVTCELTATAEEMMALMTERRFRHVPVLDDGRLAGLISIGDVVRSRVQELAEEAKTLHDYITTGR